LLSKNVRTSQQLLSQDTWQKLKSLNIHHPRRGQRGKNHLRLPKVSSAQTDSNYKTFRPNSTILDNTSSNLLNIQVDVSPNNSSNLTDDQQQISLNNSGIIPSDAPDNAIRSNPISVWISQHTNRKTPSLKAKTTIRLLKPLKKCSTKNNTPENNNIKAQRILLPSLLLCNARSILPKLDELTALLSTTSADLVAITETWLHDDIDDGLLEINGFDIHRKDRIDSRGGGVCLYVNNDISTKRRFDLEDPQFECMWLTLRPKRLPRPLSGIAVCVVYHPPGRPAESHKDLNNYLITTTDVIRNKHPDHGIILLGDFNDFDVSNLASSHTLRQVVQQPTRDSAVLDLILTNMHSIYSNPIILAPLGASDHNIVQWLPRITNKQPNRGKCVKRSVRRYPQSGIDEFGRWLTAHDWFSELGPNPTVDDLTTSFTTQLTDAIDRTFPVKTTKSHQTDKPWITHNIKMMIKDRQKAFHSGNTLQWRSLKYKVQHEIAKKKRSYYKNKVDHLKNDDCRKWWNIINRMSGRSAKSPDFVLERDGKTMCQQELANSLNDFYASVNADIPLLNTEIIPAFLPAAEEVPKLHPHDVCKKLLAVKSSKAHGPDEIPCRIVKEFAYELAEPVTTIFNNSLRSGIVPAAWKESNIVPIVKVNPPKDEGDTRPISLTPCLSKVLEDYVVTWLLLDVRDKIDPNQYGCLKGNSTTYCLLDMIHTWLSHLDPPNRHLRLCFLDFSKAFDRIGYNILIDRLLDLGVRRCLIPWIIDFLSNRRQRVKLTKAFSDWLPVTAGVPQGTKLGPIVPNNGQLPYGL